MWITQTYLSSPEPSSGLHIYYLFEDYKEKHVQVTKEIQEELERISSTYPSVCILMPSANSADRIEGELRKNQKLWERFSSDLPGIVISRKPIEKVEYDTDEIFFIPLNYAGYSEAGISLEPNKSRFAKSIQILRTMVPNELNWQHRQLGKYEGKPNGLLKGLLDAVEIKPVIFGTFRVDLKKIATLRRRS